MSHAPLPVLLLLALLLPSLALADGESRAPTPMEAAYFSRVLPVLERAAPPAPNGWEEVRRSSAEVPERVGAGIGEQPLVAEFSARWQDDARLMQARAAQEQAAGGLAARLQNEHGQAMNAIMAEVEELAGKMAQAAERGDTAAMQRHQARMEELSTRMNAIGAEQEQAVDAMAAATEAHDAEAAVVILVNRFSEALYSPAHADAPIAGLKAWRTDSAHDPNHGWAEGTSIVCLGDWKAEVDGTVTSFTAEPQPDLPMDAVQTVLVRVQADPDRARALLEAMDWNALKALLRR